MLLNEEEENHFLSDDPAAQDGGSSLFESSPGLQIPDGGVAQRKRVTLVGTFPDELDKIS